MKLLWGSSQYSSDATAAESMVFRVPRMHLLLNLRHFLPLSLIIIILSYLENPLHDFIIITGYRAYLPARDKTQGTNSSALLVICRWLHSSPPIREPTGEKRPSSTVHLPTPISSYTYNILSSNFLPDTQCDYRLIFTYRWRLTLFIPPSSMQFLPLTPDAVQSDVFSADYLVDFIHWCSFLCTWWFTSMCPLAFSPFKSKLRVCLSNPFTILDCGGIYLPLF